jgi:Na+/phosphate symporter
MDGLGRLAEDEFDANRERLQVDEVAHKVHIKNMRSMTLNLGETSLSMLEEIRTALERIDGDKPTRTRAIRLAIATMRKRMSDEGLIVEDQNP